MQARGELEYYKSLIKGLEELLKQDRTRGALGMEDAQVKSVEAFRVFLLGIRETRKREMKEARSLTNWKSAVVTTLGKEKERAREAALLDLREIHDKCQAAAVDPGMSLISLVFLRCLTDSSISL